MSTALRASSNADRANRYARDFSRDQNKRLKAKGYAIIGATWLPSVDGDFANGEREIGRAHV